MLIASGALLVLLTWTLSAMVIVSLGLLPSGATGRQLPRGPLVRGAVWWGLLILTLLAYAVNLAFPLQSSTAGIIVLCALLGAGVPGWWVWRRRSPERGRPRTAVVVGAVAVVATLAVAALGPVTNYDSGLYHLQAIRYAAEYATIPGLANVYFPLGYSNAEFPLAALMGVGPWGLEGYRLINGLVIVLALFDLVVRARERHRGAGFYVLLTGMTVVIITMLPLADYWVTSPTQDSTVFVVTVVATAYVADVVTRTRWMHAAGVAAALILLLGLLRPTMAAFALGCLVVLVTVWWRRRSSSDRRQVVTLAGVMVVATGIAAVLAAARDYLLSGWLQYPLSIVAFDVPWRAANPTDPRTATLGAARDPEDLWAAAEGWGWIPAWIERLPHQWESYAAVLLLAAAVVMVALASRSGPVRMRALLLAVLPSALAVAFWWLFTPPSFRFAWGPIFTLGTIPLGWVLWRLRVNGRRRLPHLAPLLAVSVMIGIALVTLSIRTDFASMTQRNEWQAGVTVPYVVSPPESGEVAVAVNPAGLEYLTPISGEQCWLAFPTCSPQMAGTVRLRGPGIADGYLP